jgi:hypothetical protein
LEVRLHDDGVTDIIVPVGNDGDAVTVIVNGNGKVVPLLGAIDNDSVTEPPGRIVCMEEGPPPDVVEVSVMSTAASETVLLGPAVRKFVSPPYVAVTECVPVAV